MPHRPRAALAEAIKAASSQCLARSVLSAARATTRVYNAFLRDTGLQITQFSILAAFELDRYETLSHLAEILGLERTTLLRSIDLLRRAGFVVERAGAAQSPPRSGSRPKRFDLTCVGLAALRDALPAWDKAQAAFNHALGQDETTTMRHTLSRLRRTANEIAIGRRGRRDDPGSPDVESRLP
jgi:DNA-binding MarR family transcriptional regulator